MKLPDLTRLDDSGVLEYHGHPDAIATAAGHAKLRYLNVDLGLAADKATLRRIMKKVRAIKLAKLRAAKRRR